MYRALFKAQHLLDEEFSEMFWRMCHWPIQMNAEVEDVRSRLMRFRNRYMAQLKSDQIQMTRDLHDLKAEAEKFVQLGDLKQVRGGAGRGGGGGGGHDVCVCMRRWSHPPTPMTHHTHSPLMTHHTNP